MENSCFVPLLLPARGDPLPRRELLSAAVLLYCCTAKLAPIERAAMDHDMEQNMDDTEQRIREIEAEQDKLKSQVPPKAKAPIFSVVKI